MKVYLLNLSVLPVESWDSDSVIVNQWHYSDVFSSEKKAVAFGKKMLADRLKKIKQAFKEKSMDDIVEDEMRCFFYVLEFDTDVGRGGRDGRGGYKWEDFVWWEYDYKGKLLDRTEWRDVGYSRLPDDFAEGAGIKFKAGTFVTIDDNDAIYGYDEKGTVFVVCGVPGRRADFRLGEPTWENVYRLDYIDRASRFNHVHVHESKIRIYDGIVPDDHPLQIIRKHTTGELELSDELWEDIDRRKVIFDYPKEQKSWRDIPELRDAVGK